MEPGAWGIFGKQHPPLGVKASGERPGCPKERPGRVLGASGGRPGSIRGCSQELLKMYILHGGFQLGLSVDSGTLDPPQNDQFSLNFLFMFGRRFWIDCWMLLHPFWKPICLIFVGIVCYMFGLGGKLRTPRKYCK